MIRPAVITLSLIAGSSTTARADTCDGGSTAADIIFGVVEAVASSGTGSSGSASGSSGGVAEAACGNDIHGYGECREFGSWSNRQAPPVKIEIGTAMRSFASPLRGERSSTVDHDGETFAYSIVEPEAGKQDTAVVAQLRATIGLPLGFYLGGEGEFGFVSNSRASAVMTTDGDRGTPDIERQTVSTYGGAAIAGFGARLGPVGASIESAAGFRAITYSLQSSYHACVTDTTLTAADPVLEGRARAAVWVSPFVSVGAMYGKSLVDDAWLAGAYVNWTTRAYH